jgi:hypothetical protein
VVQRFSEFWTGLESDVNPDIWKHQNSYRECDSLQECDWSSVRQVSTSKSILKNKFNGKCTESELSFLEWSFKHQQQQIKFWVTLVSSRWEGLLKSSVKDENCTLCEVIDSFPETIVTLDCRKE